MAIAVLGVRQRGSAQFSTVSRMVGAVSTQIGDNFTVMTLTAATGAAVVGDTLKGGTSAATGLVTQVLQTGPTTKVVLHTIVGVFVNESVTTFAGTGNLAGTLTTANIGALEAAGSTNNNIYQDRVLLYEGSLYCGLGNYVFKYDGSANWSVVYSLTPALAPSELNCHTGLRIFYVNRSPRLGFVWGGTSNNAIYRATSLDGATWSTAQLATGFGLKATNRAGVQREVVFNGALYFRGSYSDSGGTAHSQWDPATDAFQRVNVPVGMTDINASDLFVFKNELVQLATNVAGQATIFALRAGVWTPALVFADTGNVTGAGTGTATTQWTMFDPGDGFLYCVYYANPSPSVGWVVKRVTVSGTAYTDLGQIQASVLLGSGINAFPSGPALEGGRWYVVVDDASLPGIPATYLYYAVNDTIGTAVSVFLWIGSNSALFSLGIGGDIAISLAHTRAGGGERAWNPGRSDVVITDIASVAGGERLFFVGYGGGTKTVNFWFGQIGEVPLTKATLAGPVAGGGALSGNDVVGVPMDGVTVNQVTWNAGPTGDNVVNQSRAGLQPVAA